MKLKIYTFKPQSIKHLGPFGSHSLSKVVLDKQLLTIHYSNFQENIFYFPTEQMAKQNYNKIRLAREKFFPIAKKKFLS
jgi:hypothetical protein